MKGLDIEAAVRHAPDVPLEQGRRKQIEALITQEARAHSQRSRTGNRRRWFGWTPGSGNRARWLALAMATGVLCISAVVQGNAHLSHDTVVASRHVQTPTGWSAMLKNWRKFGQYGVHLPKLPFPPTWVSSSQANLSRKEKFFTATFVNKPSGDFLIFYADNSGRPVPISNYSINVGLSRALGVYSRQGGLQVLEWRYGRYLCSLQVARGFKWNYSEKDLMQAKRYLTIPQLISIANSTMK